MKTILRLPTAYALIILSQALFESGGLSAAETPSEALDRAQRTYAAAGPFHETLELVLTMPDGSTARRRQDYGVGAEGGAFFRLAADGREGLRIVAAEGSALATWAHIPGRYAETDYDGDFTSALRALEAPQVQLWAPPAVVAAQGGDADAFLEALQFGILQPLEPMELRASRGGVEVELRAANGTLVLGLEAGSGRFTTASFALGEGDSQIRATGIFSFEAGEPEVELVLPDVTGQQALPTLTALEASKYPLGEMAPEITVAALEGAPVDLGDLRGEVLVLDFWATWCVPCWSALEHTEALTGWAEESGLPVRVFAVGSLEQISGLAARREKARGFLEDKGLDLEVLVDHDDEAYAAFHHPGLPSLVIVDREGRLADYHSGVQEDMTEATRARVLELLEQP